MAQRKVDTVSKIDTVSKTGTVKGTIFIKMFLEITSENLGAVIWESKSRPWAWHRNGRAQELSRVISLPENVPTLFRMCLPVHKLPPTLRLSFQTAAATKKNFAANSLFPTVLKPSQTLTFNFSVSKISCTVVKWSEGICGILAA